MIPFDLDAPPSGYWRSAAGLVLERAVELRAVAGSGEWTYRAHGELKVAPLDLFTTGLGLAAIQVVLPGADGQGWRFLVPSDHAGAVLDMQVVQLTMGSPRPPSIEVDNLAYMLRAMVYHCHALVREYRNVIAAQVRSDPSLAFFSTDFYSSWEEAPYFEFEALVTAAIRTFDTARFLLSGFFLGNGKVPACLLPRIHREAPRASHASNESGTRHQ